MKYISAFIVVTIILFFPFFSERLVPFPGNFLRVWYEPWKSANSIEGVPILSHKPVADDIFRQIYPFKHLAITQMREGIMPLWNPYNGSGQPLLATMHSGFINPFNMVLFFSPGIAGWGWYVVLQPILLGLAMFWYLRVLSVSNMAALTGAVILILSGFSTTRYIYGDYTYALIALPCLLSAVEYTVRTKCMIWLFLVPIFVSFVVVSSQPQIVFYVVTFSLVYAIFRLRFFVRFLLVFILHLFFGFGLSAVQLLPTFELYRSSNMTTNASEFIINRFLMPIWHLITIAIPNYFGNQGTYNWWGSADFVETIVSVGTIPCFLAYIAWSLRRNQMVRFYIVAVIVTILFALDWFGTRLLFRMPIPVISTGIPTRIFMLTTFSLSVLAGYGIDRLRTIPSLRDIIWPVIISVTFLLILILSTIMLYLLPTICPTATPNCLNIALRNTILETAVFFIFCILFVVLIVIRKKNLKCNLFHMYVPYSSFIVGGMLAVIMVSSIYNARKFIPFSKIGPEYPTNQLLTYLRNHKDSGRFIFLGDSGLGTDFATELSLYDPNYYDPLYIKRYGELVAYANTNKYPPSLLRSDIEIVRDINLSQADEMRRDRLLSLLNVTFEIKRKNDASTSSGQIVYTDSTWQVQKKVAMPRAYIVHNVEVISQDQLLLKRLFDPSFDPSKSVLFENPIALKTVEPDSDEVKITSYEPWRVTVSTFLKKSGVLVLADTFFPGWKAIIDQKEAPVYRCNYVFRCVLLTPENHQVEFKYEPTSFTLGFAVSIGSGILLGVWYLVFRRLHTHKDTL